MDVAHVALSRGRRFFGFRAPLEAFGDFVHFWPRGRTAVAAVMLDLAPRRGEAPALRVEVAGVRVIPVPYGHLALARILAHPLARGESLEVLLSRRTFDELADDHGARRLEQLELRAGIADGDAVMSHLAACLEQTLTAMELLTTVAVEQIATSLSVHVAQRYGGFEPAPAPQSGGLAAWQLRLARATMDRRLDGSAPLDKIARDCGLSVSHFSRAFRRSTGLAPHRWLMKRRIEVAKDLMLAEPMPLAQVAVACGFADQSHFTRAFASLIGLTPARWRSRQERGLAVD